MGQPQAQTKESLSQIIQMQPGTESAARAHFQLGDLQLQGGDVETATTSFRQVPPSWPEWHARAGFAIAGIYESQLTDFDAAAREYRKVISLHPESMAGARSYSRLSELYATIGDPVSSDNMRDCAMRTYGRLADRSTDPDERDEALYRFAVASRELQRWEQALVALTACRKRALKDRDGSRRADLDYQLARLALEREQPEVALKSFKEALEHYRRKSDVRRVVELSLLCFQCHQVLGDVTAEKRGLRSMVEFVHRSKERLSDAQKCPELAPAMVRAYHCLGRVADARAVRTRLRRLKDAESRKTLATVESMIDTFEHGEAAAATEIS